MRTIAGKLRHYFDSKPHTTSRPAQTAARQNLQSDKAAEVSLPSRDRHAVQQLISECASALPGLFEIVSQSMRHDCDPYSLDVFGQNHVASMHQCPGLGRV